LSKSRKVAFDVYTVDCVCYLVYPQSRIILWLIALVAGCLCPVRERNLNPKVVSSALKTFAITRYRRIPKTYAIWAKKAYRHLWNKRQTIFLPVSDRSANYYSLITINS